MLSFVKERKGTVLLLVGMSLMAVTGVASAETGIDVSDAESALSDVATAVAAIGVLMVAAAAAGIAYRWVTAFLVK